VPPLFTEQRRKLLTKSVLATIDSALFCLKTFRSSGRLTWDVLDSTLQDCLALLEATVGSVPDSNQELNRSNSSYFVRLSHLYYTQYLDFQRDPDGPKDLQRLRALKRSIECVKGRSAAEKAAGFLSTKLERLAGIFATTGRYNDARDAFISLRDELLELGTLLTIVTAAKSLPHKVAWESDDNTISLSRTIAALLKLELKFQTKSVLSSCFFESTWSSEEKGIMLEFVLEILSVQTRDVLVFQRSVVHELLEIYEFHTFPVRRLRALTQILRLGTNERQDLREDAKNSLVLIGIDGVVQKSEDEKLQCYIPHLKAFISTTLELQEDHPRVDLLRQDLATWSPILEESKDLQSLLHKIDDIPRLLLHLQSIADFLDLKGHGETRVAVLRMIANLNECNPPTSSPDDLLLSYSSLGLQFLKLGYSGKAGLALDRAQSYSASNGITSQASLRYLLAYSEYLLVIGNSDKW